MCQANAARGTVLPACRRRGRVASFLKLYAQGPVAASVHAKLTAALEPSVLMVINESDKHNVPPGSETVPRLIYIHCAVWPRVSWNLLGSQPQGHLSAPAGYVQIIIDIYSPKWESE